MDIIVQLVRKIKNCRLDQPDKLLVLIGKLQTHKDINQGAVESDLIFYGLAFGLEKIADHRIFHLHSDETLNILSDQIREIEIREGLDEGEFYERGDPDSPEDYQALNIEFQFRIDEIRAEVMQEFEEEEMADLFIDKSKEYIRRFHSGWRILEKNNPEALTEIDEHEKDELSEFL
jgi:hypothetical protein